MDDTVASLPPREQVTPPSGLSKPRLLTVSPGGPGMPTGQSPTNARKTAIAYVSDTESAAAMVRSFADLGFVDSRVVHGTIDLALGELAQHGAPSFLVVDVSGIDDPMARINRLAGACGAETRIIAVGDRNDIVLYRDMKAVGVAEYFFKPLMSSVMTRVLGGLASGIVEPHGPRTGKLVLALGVRGGVGATTIATQIAWVLAERHERYVLMVDLDLQSGDAAHQLNAHPSHALLEALDRPDRVDDLFLDRGAIKVTPHLALLAAGEPLSDLVAPQQERVLQLLGALTHRYRFVIVDMPLVMALKLPKVLQLANVLLLVSDGSQIAAQEITRWRDRIGHNTPGRSILHVLNKKGGDGALPDGDFIRALAQPPDVAITYDRRIAKAGQKGAGALYASGVMQSGIATLIRELAGVRDEPPRSRWQRWFG